MYAALTWVGAQPAQSPIDAAAAVSLLVKPPSSIVVLAGGLDAALRTLEMAARHNLTARRIHDARHAATALCAGVSRVFTYDPDDWKLFTPDGIRIVGPASTLEKLAGG